MAKALQATVRSGQLVLDPPVDLPEGQVVELQLVDPGDEMDEMERAKLQLVDPGDEMERAKLHRALLKSAQQADQGELIPAEQVLAALRARQ